MAITSGLESLANLEAVEAQTGAVEQSTYERKETFDTRKAAAELTFEQAEYAFDELKGNRDTRDALNALQYESATQYHQALKDNPHYVAAKMQVELHAKEWELGDKQLGRLYDMQYARGQEIERALASGDPDAIERANFHFQALQEEYQSTTGEPFDVGIEREGFQGLTLKHLPYVREMNRIAAQMGPYARERANLLIKQQPSASDQLGMISDTLKIKGTTRANAGNAFLNLPGNLSDGVEITGTGHVQLKEGETSKSQSQVQSLVSAMEQIAGIELDVNQITAEYGKYWKNIENSSEGLMEDNFTYLMPTGKAARLTGFTQEAFEAAVMREAKKNNLSNQQQADIAVNENMRIFVNMVTSGELD